MSNRTNRALSLSRKAGKSAAGTVINLLHDFKDRVVIKQADFDLGDLDGDGDTEIIFRFQGGISVPEVPSWARRMVKSIFN